MTVVNRSLREMVVNIGPYKREASFIPDNADPDSYMDAVRAMMDESRRSRLDPISSSDVACAMALAVDIMRAEGKRPVLQTFLGTNGYVLVLDGKPSPLAEGDARYKGTADLFRKHMAASASADVLESVICTRKGKLAKVLFRSLY